jgi:hypothetical protein
VRPVRLCLPYSSKKLVLFTYYLLEVPIRSNRCESRIVSNELSILPGVYDHEIHASRQPQLSRYISDSAYSREAAISRVDLWEQFLSKERSMDQ